VTGRDRWVSMGVIESRVFPKTRKCHLASKQADALARGRVHAGRAA
jgi:hypothetical protein